MVFLPVTEIISLAPLHGDARATPEKIRGGVISIGNFDGVHLGHANLLGEVRRHANQADGPAIAVVLDPHPATILRPDRIPPKLTNLSRRAERMAPIGIDFLVACETSVEFLRLSAEQFFQSLVVQRLDCRGIVEGPNFFFGRDRGGDVGKLDSMCQTAGVALHIVQPTVLGETMISSTRVRQSLDRGEIGAANQLLGSPYRLSGTVVRGDQRGRKIGFPTANLAGIDTVIPAPGVYGGRTSIDGRSQIAAVHIGPRPTFDASHWGKSPNSSPDPRSSSTVEVHVLGYTGDLYGRTLSVDLAMRVRDIARFDSAVDLARQLSVDVDTIRQRLLKKE